MATKEHKNGVSSVGDVVITTDEKGNDTYEVLGGMSDAAIDAANGDSPSALSWLRPFRYAPSLLTADILERTSTDSNLIKQDIITIALIAFQSLTETQITDAVTQYMGEKAKDLYRSLR